MIDLYELQQKAWQTAESKGWHAKLARNPDGALHNDSFGSQLNLIHSEAGEGELETAHYKHVSLKPEGVIVELADVVIRAFDLMWNAGISAGFLHSVELETDDIHRELRHYIDSVTESLRNFGYGDERTQNALRDVVGAAFAVANEYDYDNEEFLCIIREKMAFNETRPERHGGKVV